MENSGNSRSFWQSLLGSLLGGNQSPSPQPQQPQGVPVDLNRDGNADALAVDTNFDGRVDQLQSDSNQDGYIDEVAVDTDQDGALDTVYFDKNQDGQFETSARLEQEISMNIETSAPTQPTSSSSELDNGGVSTDEFDPNADVSEWR